MAITKFDLRQSVLRQAQSMIGSGANETADSVFARVDAELAKLFEDRNVILTDGGTITFTGTQLQFTENLNIVVNSKIAGTSPQVISLGSSNVNLSNGDIWYATLNRTAGTATTAVAQAMPSVVASNSEVFLIAKRVDAGDGTQRVYWRSGMAMNAGQSVRLGASGSGSGSGTGDDLDALNFRASFTDLFSENATNSNSGVNSSGTNAVYNAAKTMYVMSYDAAKTITTVGTAATMSSAPAFTVAVGDVVYLPSTGEVKKITAVASQTSYTLESAFAANQTAAAATVSQAVHTKDIYNLPVDGAALSAAFGSATFSEIMVDYKDNATSGSNVFTPNTAASVAFAASPDASSWTTAQKRATNETDTFQSAYLNSAGTGLYLRFFAAKTSGSGTVNLINYKAFMQKTAASAAGGVFNSAYALSNGAGTPVNCSVATVGGKTQIILSWSYAVGVNSNPPMPYGSVDVFVDGKLIPRYISAASTPQGSYYTEVSGNIIQLDSDYSSVAVDIIVLQRAQIVDASSTNSTAIMAIQEATNMGFQGFVNTSNTLSATTTTGTPASGKFYSSIQNRASIVDVTQDLKARMGVERVMIEQIYQLQNEFGPNGETVFAALNDDRGMMRFVGSWSNNNDGYGQYAQTLVVGDFVEYTFYGTGLNTLCYTAAAARDIRVSVDGGSEGANIFAASPYSSVIVGRNYSENSVVNLVSGLTLGVHTVKVRNNHANGTILYGFEVLNESSSVKVNPGTSYIAGAKLVSSSQSAFAYNSSVTGTKGGRVLVYQNSDGTIKSAFQAVNASIGYLNGADHSNEEMVRTYNFREFGAARSDDFSKSFITTSSQSVSFTLDDGTTTLVGSAVTPITTGSLPEAVQFAGAGSFLTFTFVGTGLDILCYDEGTTLDTYSILVDGASAGGSFAAIGTANILRTRKIASGLPYGTHTVKITRSNTGSSSLAVLQFLVYQPKKPSLPSGCVELADYNVMANYSANTTAGVDTIATGVLRKFISQREAIYSGTWSVSQDLVNNPGGWKTNSGTVGDYVQYTFFGTGFEFRFQEPSAAINIQATLDGSTSFSSYTNSVYGTGVSFTASTGILAMSGTATNACGLSVSGLSLGLHTIKFAISSNPGATAFYPHALDVIAPIHSAKSNAYADLQNTLPVGSQGISDNRKVSAIKEALSATKAWGQAFGTVVNPSTTSTSLVPCADMSLTIKTSGAPLDISYSLNAYNITAGAVVKSQIYVDGVPVGSLRINDEPVGGGYQTILSDRIIVPVSAGTHKVDIYWAVSSSTATSDGIQRSLVAREI
jgi:hypothetical protein